MGKLPSVSCILPLGYGDKFLDVALECFFNQEYDGDIELVIVDNNDQPMEALADIFFIRYIRTTRKPVGALRNEGIRHAVGQVICIWDEDDYHAPNRVAEQVKRLEETGKAVTGWHNVLYYDTVTGGTFKYLNSPTGHRVPPYAMGASHCFLKSWWEQHPYIEDGIEDQIFSDVAMHANQLDSVDAGQLYVARAHKQNVCQLMGGRHFPAVSRETFPAEFFQAIGLGSCTNSADGAKQE